MNEHEPLTKMQDAAVEEALRNFRLSVRHWSDREAAMPRSVRAERRSGFWMRMPNPALSWTLAAAVMVASVGIPFGIHHRDRVEADRQAALAAQQRHDAEQAREAAKAAAESVTDDEDFLNHVDSDIAQATPEALQPLASLMSDSSAK